MKIIAKEISKKIQFKRNIKDFFLISLGVLSAGLGLKGFLLPNSFLDGGVTGISLLVASLTGFKLPVLIFLFNIPFIYMGWRQISWTFAAKTILAILGLALAITFINYPIITSDKLLISIFGGFFLGAGIGFSIRGGSVIDGTEVLALYISRSAGIAVGDIIFAFNVIIFATAAFLINLETAMYAILTYLSASKTVDLVIHGFEEYVSITIVSTQHEEIRVMITQNLGHGVTILKGKSGYGKRGASNELDIIYTVISRLEVSKLRTEVEKIDENAFIIQSIVDDTKGGMLKKKFEIKI